MNCTGLHTDFHATLEQSKQATAKIARIATEAQAECERMAKRIESLESALNDAARLVGIARQYFPKSIKDSDRFELELTCATINNALRGK